MKKVHFLGIAGQMMCGLAVIAKSQGYEVSGSDENAYPPATTTLEQNGIQWISGHKKENLGDPDLIVLGNHIRAHNVELQSALERKLKIVSFPEFISILYPDSKNQVVIAGAHGKSTTTSLIGWILTEGKLDPTVLIGAISRNFENNFRQGASDFIVIEGDEYSSSCLDISPKFSHYLPMYGIITSIELDHMDLYADLDSQFDVFVKFSQTVSDNGILLVCSDSVDIPFLQQRGATHPFITYGFSDNADWRAKDVRFEPEKTTFVLDKGGSLVGEFSTPLAGKHNVLNTVAAISVAKTYGMSNDAIQTALNTFKGVGKRFDVRGEFGGVLLIEDYAHHPTAIKTTLEAARMRYGKRKIWCVYEPHTYSRIKGVLPQFNDAFVAADEIIISDIFSAREKALEGMVHTRDIVEVAKALSPNIHYVAKPEQILEYLSAHLVKGDVVVFMAVGNMDNITQKLGESLTK
jgi:UDP-N-acetylmuramate: L-alanyl-gamma-D-glutamyl-meso-diaminopimelate ligase